MSMADLILTGVDDKVLITVSVGTIIFLIAGFLILNNYRNSSSQREQLENMRNGHQSFDSDACPICLGLHRLTVETNCGHKFCGTCLKNYLNRLSGGFSLFSGRMSCPLCRQDVNILLHSFTIEDARSTDLEEERSSVERFVHEYNVRFGSGPRTLWSYVRDCPVLLRHMIFEFFTLGGLVWVFRLRVIFCCLGAIVYFFNPLDFIPEAVLGIFGFLDDLIVFLLCVIYISIIYRRVIIRRSMSATI